MPDAPAVTPVAEGTVPWPQDAAREYVARGWWRGRPLAAKLTGDLGLRRGDRIVVQLPNCWEFTVLLLG